MREREREREQGQQPAARNSATDSSRRVLTDAGAPDGPEVVLKCEWRGHVAELYPALGLWVVPVRRTTTATAAATAAATVHLGCGCEQIGYCTSVVALEKPPGGLETTVTAPYLPKKKGDMAIHERHSQRHNRVCVAVQKKHRGFTQRCVYERQRGSYLCSSASMRSDHAALSASYASCLSRLMNGSACRAPISPSSGSDGAYLANHSHSPGTRIWQACPRIKASQTT